MMADLQIKDLRGKVFSVGCIVARAVAHGGACFIDLATVTRIENGKLYLNSSKQAMRFPSRLVIVEQDEFENCMLNNRPS